MRIALKGQGDGWVIDNIVNDYKKHTTHKVVGIDESPEALWCVNLFSFPSIVNSIPNGCKKFLQIHHIDENKISHYNFAEFNKADVCIVPNKITEKVVSKYVNIPIKRLPYWVLSSYISPKNEDKVDSLKHEIATHGETLIGSFVKDGNGKVGNTPKLIKGPDTLIEALTELVKHVNIKVVLGGYGRAWVTKRLDSCGIPYVYYEKYNDVNSLYDCLDYYFVTARVEGGAQAVLEGSFRKVKILSTDVGIAPEILHPECICHNARDFANKVVNKEEHIDYNYKSIQEYLPGKIIPKFDNFFKE